MLLRPSLHDQANIDRAITLLRRSYEMGSRAHRKRAQRNEARGRLKTKTSFPIPVPVSVLSSRVSSHESFLLVTLLVNSTRAERPSGPGPPNRDRGA